MNASEALNHDNFHFEYRRKAINPLWFSKNFFPCVNTLFSYAFLEINPRSDIITFAKFRVIAAS